MPEDFRPNDQHRDMASKLGIDLEEAFAKFRDYHGSKGNTFKDWNQALNNWLRNELKFNRGGNNDVNGNRARQRKADNLAAGRVVIRDLGLAG